MIPLHYQALDAFPAQFQNLLQKPVTQSLLHFSVRLHTLGAFLTWPKLQTSCMLG
jgi:hypothetical protein